MIVPDAPPTSADIAHHYDALDAFYRELWGEHVHHGLWLKRGESVETAVMNLIDRVAETAEIGPGSAVCDVGSGYGATGRYLYEMLGARVTGFTLSKVQFIHAVRQNPDPDNVIYKLQDWCENQLPDHSFDAVIAVESLSHMADKPAFFAQAYRVIRPGGRLVLAAWLTSERPRNWQKRLFLKPICRDGRLPSLGSAAEYESMMADAGFTEPGHEDLSRRVRSTWTICARRVCWHLVRHPKYFGFLFDRLNRDRHFARLLPVVRLAYSIGGLRYGIISARKG